MNKNGRQWEPASHHHSCSSCTPIAVPAALQPPFATPAPCFITTLCPVLGLPASNLMDSDGESVHSDGEPKDEDVRDPANIAQADLHANTAAHNIPSKTVQELQEFIIRRLTDELESLLRTEDPQALRNVLNKILNNIRVTNMENPLLSVPKVNTLFHPSLMHPTSKVDDNLSFDNDLPLNVDTEEEMSGLDEDKEALRNLNQAYLIEQDQLGDVVGIITVNYSHLGDFCIYYVQYKQRIMPINKIVVGRELYKAQSAQTFNPWTFAIPKQGKYHGDIGFIVPNIQCKVNLSKEYLMFFVPHLSIPAHESSFTNPSAPIVVAPAVAYPEYKKEQDSTGFPLAREHDPVPLQKVLNPRACWPPRVHLQTTDPSALAEQYDMQTSVDCSKGCCRSNCRHLGRWCKLLSQVIDGASGFACVRQTYTSLTSAEVIPDDDLLLFLKLVGQMHSFKLGNIHPKSWPFSPEEEVLVLMMDTSPDPEQSLHHNDIPGVIVSTQDYNCTVLLNGVEEFNVSYIHPMKKFDLCNQVVLLKDVPAINELKAVQLEDSFVATVQAEWISLDGQEGWIVQLSEYEVKVFLRELSISIPLHQNSIQKISGATLQGTKPIWDTLPMKSTLGKVLDLKDPIPKSMDPFTSGQPYKHLEVSSIVGNHKGKETSIVDVTQDSNMKSSLCVLVVFGSAGGMFSQEPTVFDYNELPGSGAGSNHWAISSNGPTSLASHSSFPLKSSPITRLDTSDSPTPPPPNTPQWDQTLAEYAQMQIVYGWNAGSATPCPGGAVESITNVADVHWILNPQIREGLQGLDLKVAFVREAEDVRVALVTVDGVTKVQ
ncbi:hypothetical protein BT96DRAFT_987877 [Gymnopus androsaceus JB14]|uniref:Uncharacterized protein n=1 Tax=Gymnopus androsaceus JB14 TaxID=1447944 RepID=A0A6A4IBL3_9AGAR|nr:hypothetical protein BT96DRAFT_987877 [Gymnopus androsaceus JB14]